MAEFAVPGYRAKRVLLALGTAALVLLVLAPPLAAAASLTRAGSELVLQGDPSSESLSVFLGQSRTTAIAPPGLQIPPGCAPQPPGGVVACATFPPAVGAPSGCSPQYLAGPGVPGVPVDCDTTGVTAIRIFGGGGDDTLAADPGQPPSFGAAPPPKPLGPTVFLDGGDGNDTFEAPTPPAPVVIDGGPGDDTMVSLTVPLGLIARGGAGNDEMSADTAGAAPSPNIAWVLDGGDGNDHFAGTGGRGPSGAPWVLLGGAGNDSMDYVFGAASVVCGPGADFISFAVYGKDPADSSDCGPYLSIHRVTVTYVAAAHTLVLQLGRLKNASAQLRLRFTTAVTRGVPTLLAVRTFRLGTGVVRLRVRHAGFVNRVLPGHHAHQIRGELGLFGKTHRLGDPHGDAGGFAFRVPVHRR